MLLKHTPYDGFFLRELLKKEFDQLA